MGRSVIPHPNATVTGYLEFAPEHYCLDCETFTESGHCPDCGEYVGCDYSCDHGEEWREFVQWVSDTARELWPSFYDVDARTVSYWSENYVCAENRHSEISISEYCGSVAVSLAPRSDLGDYWEDSMLSDTLGAHWRRQVSERFLSTFSTRTPVATLSDGTTVYSAT